ncbi:MAG: Hpt domain-containing protein [Winogradskyella arenosi]
MKEQPNLKYINELSGGDLFFEDKILSVIKKEFPEEKRVYYKNLRDKNYPQVAEIVHKIKHKISILGLENGYHIAVEYENNLLEDNNLKLKEEFESILQSISYFLNQL